MQNSIQLRSQIKMTQKLAETCSDDSRRNEREIQTRKEQKGK